MQDKIFHFADTLGVLVQERGGTNQRLPPCPAAEVQQPLLVSGREVPPWSALAEAAGGLLLPALVVWPQFEDTHCNFRAVLLLGECSLCTWSGQQRALNAGLQPAQALPWKQTP